MLNPKTIRRRFGDIISHRPIASTGPTATVTFTGPDSNGNVVWTFKNTGTTTGSWILQRGASLGGQQLEDYVFGQAFNVMYLYNAQAFGTSFLTSSPTPLVDNGVNNNSPPMAVVKASTGTSICFIFTLSAGQEWSMIEGGFQNGVVPSNPILIPVTLSSQTPQTFCYTWNPEQCQGYNQQAGTNLPCPPNPWQIYSMVFTTSVSIPILIQDTFTEGPCPSGNTGSSGFACTSQIQALANDLMRSAPISTTISDAISLLECLVENNYIPVMDLIKAITRIEEQRLRKEL